MKPSWDWNEDDILDMIANGVEEHLELDYKASAALGTTDGKKAEISKDVSAFANSAGGTIVYGVEEDRATYKPVRIDGGYDPAGVIKKEWLEQVINSKIHRRIDGIRINPVALPKTSPGNVLYVVSIPQSNRAPHQAADKRFYKRYNFESIAVEEYEIRDVARRSETPDLYMTVGFRRMSDVIVSDAGNEVTFRDLSSKRRVSIVFSSPLKISFRAAQVAGTPLGSRLTV